MRILYLCSDLGVPVLGAKGAGVHVRELVAAFGRAGHSVALAAPTLTKSPWEQPAEVDATVLHVPPSAEVEACVSAARTFTDALGVGGSLPGELRAILAQGELLDLLGRRFESAPPDFVYERASLYGTAGAELARKLGVRRVLELNAPLAEEHARRWARDRGTSSELARRAERSTLLAADAVLTVSGPLRDHVVALGVSPERVHVLPNGVDTARFGSGPPESAIRTHWGLGAGPILGFVGSLRSWQGTENLPVLLQELAPRHPGVQLVIAGDGPLRHELEREFDRRGLRESVVFTGWLPHEQVPGLIRHFDVALAPYSEKEHLWYASPMKLFEYMACGKPVVAAALGQIEEVVRDGETGVLYSHGDPDGLAKACERLLSDPELRERLGRAAAEQLDGRYSWDGNAAYVTALAADLREAREATP
jgi:glycosyltransferase involved in cell wall biosynthesis